MTACVAGYSLQGNRLSVKRNNFRMHGHVKGVLQTFSAAPVKEQVTVQLLAMAVCFSSKDPTSAWPERQEGA